MEVFDQKSIISLSNEGVLIHPRKANLAVGNSFGTSMTSLQAEQFLGSKISGAHHAKIKTSVQIEEEHWLVSNLAFLKFRF